ncbi:dipeptidase 2 [Oryzias melastigma]|uniref:Dipeptidase n=1 Tax=Oryzias melastigma TaxID=30732 RepID=A0A3B3CA18_ORYME|nr:dipeptidase 2 [Oryzias melastigma]
MLSSWSVMCLWILLTSIPLFTSAKSEKERALELMKDSPLIDGHNDLPLKITIHYRNNLSRVDLYNINEAATDISRLKTGHVQTQMFAVYVLCGAQGKDAVRLTLEQIDLVKRMCNKAQDLELVKSYDDLISSSMKHKIACLISIEGGHSIDSSLAVLRMFYDLGVRSMSLTHNCNTPWAEAATDLYNVFQRENNSLTQFGKAVVEEMNRLGMIVDLSHSSWETASATLKHSRAPVIFSHSSSHSICNHKRNVPDWLLRELKKKNGLIMVNLYSKFISCGKEANISDVADHFDHIRKIIGAKSIGIGGDFDGADSFPQGLKDVSKYPALIEELLKRNWSKEDLSGVLRENFLRVFKEVENVRDSSTKQTPSEEQIPPKEIHNSCRLDLENPIIPVVRSSTSGARFIVPSLPLISSLLVLYSLFMNK